MFYNIYDQWLELCQDEQELLDELVRVKDDFKEVEDRFYRDLDFGTGGMRGILGAGTNRVNVFTIRRAAAGLADYLVQSFVDRNACVVIGYDSRKHSERLALESALMLNARGIKAFLFDTLRPVPMLSFAIRELNALAGVYITASHNPPEYNGFKVYGDDGVQISPQIALKVTEKMNALAYHEQQPIKKQESISSGLLFYIGEEVDKSYNKMLQELLIVPETVRRFGDRLKIVYTPLHGTGNLPVRKALETMGIMDVIVVPSQKLPDPSSATVRVPNPEEPAALSQAIALAKQMNADIVLGTDPDCDRLGVAAKDNDGDFRLLSGNQIGCLLLHHILTQMRKKGILESKDAVVTTIVSTNMARAICEDFGIQYFEVLTGFKFIGEKIQEFQDTNQHRFVFGFEESYGFLSGTKVRDKDAVNAAVLLSEVACACVEEGITLVEKLERLFKRYGYYYESAWSQTFHGQEGRERILNTMSRLRNSHLTQIGQFSVVRTRDYMKGLVSSETTRQLLNLPKSDVLYFELEGEAWVCARPSGTEPKIKFYVGAKDSNSIEGAIDKAESILKSICEYILDV